MRNYVSNWKGIAQPGYRAGETRELSDWPPVRGSGPEPGSNDMRNEGIDLGGITESIKTMPLFWAVVLLGGGFLAGRYLGKGRR